MGVKFIPADPEKHKAMQAKLEEARKGTAEVVAEIMDTTVKAKTVAPREYESPASEDGKAIAAGMQVQAFGAAPAQEEKPEKSKEKTPADILLELEDEHGTDWVIDTISGL